MRKIIARIALCLPILVAAHAAADWDNGDPYKWLQRPDLSTLGIDVNCSTDPSGQGYILADDFECTETGYITDVHIWGSWRGDFLPNGDDPTNVIFTLSLHADIPDTSSPTGYSIPGQVLWTKTFLPGEFVPRIWQGNIEEGWMDPPSNYIFPGDFTCWQYNFLIDQADAFLQVGTPDNPVVYWLDVQATPGDPNAFFGWKTSTTHWNDDAVWGVGTEPFPGPWNELIYPPGHEQAGQSIDLAFVITGGPPQTDELDLGDAPDATAFPGYPTLLVHNGARHTVGGPWLGDASDTPDIEPDGQPHPNALGDDNDGNDDEDGVTIPPLVRGQNATIIVEVNGGGGIVDGWIDWNADATWTAAEKIFSGALAPGLHAINVAVPPAATLGQSFARFRINTAAALPPDGAAPDGEVEDYEVYIRDETSCKWLQNPDLATTGIDVNATSEYILADDFLCTETGLITEIWVWGSWRNDAVPFGNDPTAVDFTLSIHKDIPDTLSPTGYSMPDAPVWTQVFTPGTFTAEVWQAGLAEGWMDPPSAYFFPGDTVCWLYKFRIDYAEAYEQLGTEEEPIVYWLDVQAIPHDPDAFFGWKTSLEHWNDDAVWGQGFEPYLGPWGELIYPSVHPLGGESIDLAFCIRSDISTGASSSGDAVPERFGLDPNKPNPFNPTTKIRYEIPGAGGPASLQVYDVAGRLVRTLVDGEVSGGVHYATWDGTDENGRELSSGVYFYRLRAGGQESTRKMLLLK